MNLPVYLFFSFVAEPKKKKVSFVPTDHAVPRNSVERFDQLRGLDFSSAVYTFSPGRLADARKTGPLKLDGCTE